MRSCLLLHINNYYYWLHQENHPVYPQSTGNKADNLTEKLNGNAAINENYF